MIGNEHVLFLRPDKAGDAIKTLPVLRSLRQRFPDLHISILVSHHNESVFAFEKGVRTYTLPKNWESFDSTRLRTLVDSLPFEKRIDIAINLLCDSFPQLDRLIGVLPAKTVFSHHVNLSLPENSPAFRDERKNIALLVEQALKVQVLSEIEGRRFPPVLCALDELEAQMAMGNKEGAWIGICPFAGNSNRTHPDKRWQKFIKKITHKSEASKIFIFGSRADRSRLEELKQASKTPDKIQICYPSSFRALGAYLQRTDGIIAVDSGPLHLAHALGIRSLGFLSGGDYKRWFPELQESDALIHRGRITRYPFAWEMFQAFRQWSRSFRPSVIK